MSSQRPSASMPPAPSSTPEMWAVRGSIALMIVGMGAFVLYDLLDDGSEEGTESGGTRSPVTWSLEGIRAGDGVEAEQPPPSTHDPAEGDPRPRGSISMRGPMNHGASPFLRNAHGAVVAPSDAVRSPRERETAEPPPPPPPPPPPSPPPAMELAPEPPPAIEAARLRATAIGVAPPEQQPPEAPPPEAPPEGSDQPPAEGNDQPAPEGSEQPSGEENPEQPAK